MADPTKQQARLRSGAIFCVKALITIIILWVVMNRVELTDLKDSLLQPKLSLVVVAMGLWLPLIACGAQRWRLVASTFGETLPFRAAVFYFWIGLFVSKVLPTVMGLDATRTFKMYQGGTRLGLAARIVIVDRLCALVSLLLIIGAGAPLIWDLTGGQFFKVVVVILACGSLGLTLLASFHSFVDARPTTAGLSHLWRVSNDLSRALCSCGKTANIICWGACNHLCRVAIIICLALSLDLHLSPLHAFALVPVALLITMAPISLGGWGVRELVFIEVLGLAGIASASALALSILYGLVGITIGLIGSAIWTADHWLAPPPDTPSNPLTRAL